ncbi:hypothetical protein [Chitinophaga caseinilytica]|uniref:Uncharacterized protein n=1 Tax=Chitinophaga caseinilytica TaxID=2267521 RepID=A0ABZ2Z069_9BACT
MFKDLKNLVFPITDRARNPLFGSFLVSWLLVNWRVLIVWGSDTETYLAEANVKNFIKYVEATPYFQLIWLPLIMAVSYQLITPLVKMLHTWLNEYFRTITSQTSAKISKGAWISVKHYQELEAEYHSYIQQMKELIIANGIYVQQAKEATDQKEAIKKRMYEAQEKKDRLQEQMTEAMEKAEKLQTMLLEANAERERQQMLLQEANTERERLQKALTETSNERDELQRRRGRERAIFATKPAAQRLPKEPFDLFGYLNSFNKQHSEMNMDGKWEMTIENAFGIDRVIQIEIRTDMKMAFSSMNDSITEIFGFDDILYDHKGKTAILKLKPYQSATARVHAEWIEFDFKDDMFVSTKIVNLSNPRHNMGKVILKRSKPAYLNLAGKSNAGIRLNF